MTLSGYHLKILFTTSIALLLLSTYGFLSGPELQIKEGKQAKVRLLVGPEYPDQVLKLIDGAKKRVWVSLYLARYSKKKHWAIENKMLKALVERYKRGVDVRVILDASLSWNPKSGRMDGEENKKNENAFDYLKGQGVPVRYDSLDQIMHGKFLVIDELYSIVGSTNWSYSALKKNVEISNLLISKHHNTRLAKIHEGLWEACKNQTPWKIK